MLHRCLMACFKCHFQFTKLFKKSCTERNLKILHYNTMLNKFCSYLTLNIGQIFSIQIIACVYLKKKLHWHNFCLIKFLVYIYSRICALCVHIWNWEPHQSVQHQWSLGSTCCSPQHHHERPAVHRGWNQHWRGQTLF